VTGLGCFSLYHLLGGQDAGTRLRPPFCVSACSGRGDREKLGAARQEYSFRMREVVFV
jgi:hypothetical protein